MHNGFHRTCKAFADAGLADPLGETLKLLDIVANGAVRRMDGDVLAEFGTDLRAVIARRLDGEPLEYILGRATFMGLRFYSTPACLIPRQETELLARTALEGIHQIQSETETPLVIDMGTGCGNLAVSLAVHAPQIRVLASDISAEAVAVAAQNVRLHQVASRVTLFCGDLFVSLADADCKGRVDLVVCNPPYIPTSTLARMAPEIIGHEPVEAFAAGAYGIDIFRRLIAEAPIYLKPGGMLVFEIGEGQERLVLRLLERSGKYAGFGQHPDNAGKIRVLSASTSPGLG